MATDLYIELPDDFETKYLAYRARVLDLSTSKEHEASFRELINKKPTVNSITNKFKLLIKDREIWVNEYLIGKPHAVGSNLEFFEYVCSQAPHTKINRNELPSKFGNLSTQNRVKNKSFIKILNGLGFKGEILKAFFYKRGKDTLIYRGDEIIKNDLEKAGVKILLFFKELELAHTKNSPE
ncbi:MAG: hypothetical protein NUV47_01875 [Patescibacteria group bacterium]|nr:hypothetical protein [Patescibacteria group bacterium]